MANNTTRTKGSYDGADNSGNGGPTGGIPIIARQWMNLEHAAKYADTTPWFLRTAIWNKQLVARMAGQNLIIHRDDLDDFLKSLPVFEEKLKRGRQPKAETSEVAA